MKSCAAFAKPEQFIMLYVWSRVVGGKTRDGTNAKQLACCFLWFVPVHFLKEQEKNSVRVL